MASKGKKPRVFVRRNDYTEEQLRPLRERCEVDLWEGPLPMPREEFLKRVKGCAVIVCSLPMNPGEKIDQEVIDAAGPSLIAIVAPLAGYDHIDMDAMRRSNIPVGNSPHVFDKGVSEHAITLILMALYRVPEHMKTVYDPTLWIDHNDKPLYPYGGRCLYGKTVGIVGFGGIGLEIAKRLKHFNLSRLIYHSRSEKLEDAKAVNAEFVSFEDLLSYSDVVIIACSLNDSTRGMFGSKEFEKMKNNAILVNVARGEVVKQEQLEDALKSGQIGFAALDVTTPEPLPWHHSLLKLPNCLVTPHMAVSAQDVYRQGFNVGVENVLAALDGKKMLFK